MHFFQNKPANNDFGLITDHFHLKSLYILGNCRSRDWFSAFNTKFKHIFLQDFRDNCKRYNLDLCCKKYTYLSIATYYFFITICVGKNELWRILYFRVIVLQYFGARAIFFGRFSHIPRLEIQQSTWKNSTL